ncbi:MAG: twin-arginine translocation signal domain-containing protein, partial [Actinobacteria bacterium]|nr:twin-arginine translocation signal domain-containing protein [Actinomycetota bacterium]
MGATMKQQDSQIISRRNFLAGSAAVGAMLVMPSGVRAAFGASPATGDVVVVNFLNRRNEADRRVFELLSEKFCLFEFFH